MGALSRQLTEEKHWFTVVDLVLNYMYLGLTFSQIKCVCRAPNDIRDLKVLIDLPKRRGGGGKKKAIFPKIRKLTNSLLTSYCNVGTDASFSKQNKEDHRCIGDLKVLTHLPQWGYLPQDRKNVTCYIDYNPR